MCTFDASQVEDFAVSDGDIEVSPNDNLRILIE